MTRATTLLCVLLGFVFPPSSLAQSAPARSFADSLEGTKKIDGFVPLYWNETSGRLLMEVSRFRTELLYQVSLPAGIGSNPLGLDRGQLGDTHVVVFERIGPKVLLVERNYRYRALSQDPAERRAVDESFATSVLWGFTIDAVDGERVLVDATAFFLRDAHGVGDRLRQAEQGRYRADEGRSAIYLPRTKGFPRNTEVEAVVTLVTDERPGSLVAQVTPTPQTVTVRQHHSFVELPPLDGSFGPRAADPRVGVIDLVFNDYASPITAPVDKHWVTRHRLVKKDPAAAVSEPVAPIVYYVDNGAPEPIRTALIEGAAWWNQAFDAIGFRNAFQVRILPEDADPMDIRFNMINWVHRSTRGWSYGASVVDPRTGEILKGNVSLGSLRVRHDYLIGTGLVPVASASTGGNDRQPEGGLAYMAPDGRFACDLGDAPDTGYLEALDPTVDAAAMSLARIRQLSAHEVGHTLGFEHNFAASTYGRASVMDYPAPLVTIANGAIDLSNAYAAGVGRYDMFAVRYAYSQFAPGVDETAAIERILEEGVAAGMVFVADGDARPDYSAHPLGSLWDNGEDAIAGLRDAMEVRRIGLERFGLANLPAGAPLSQLETRLLPLFLHHRYELQAAMKFIGGAFFSYAVKTGSGVNPQLVQQIVPAATQRAALVAVLDTLSPQALTISRTVLALIPPRAASFGGTNTELFPGRTRPIFDPIAAATLAADLTVSGLLQPQRAARLTVFHAMDARNPSFADVLDALVKRTWSTPAPKGGLELAVHRAVQSLTTTRLMDLAGNSDASPDVRAEASEALRRLRTTLEAGTAGIGTGGAHRRATIEGITRFLNRPDAPERRTSPPPVPAGEPIG
jgi:hypothetical protein